MQSLRNLGRFPIRSLLPLRAGAVSTPQRLASDSSFGGSGSSKDKGLVEHKKRGEIKISVPVKDEVSILSGVPEEEIKTRFVRIYVPTKAVTQSGTHNSKNWRLDFNNVERWENPLMGWTSTADALSNIHLEFPTKEAAIEYCEKNNWKYQVDKPKRPFLKPKSYGANFSWNKRTRTTQK